MRKLTTWIVLTASVVLTFLLASPPREAAGAATQPGAVTAPPRVATYFANFPLDASLVPNLAMLVESGRRGYLTHVIVGLFHCAWVDWTHGRGETISLNGTYLDDPRLVPLWQAIKVVQAHGVKVIASVGGGPNVGDFGHLLDPDQPRWYPELRRALQEHGFDGFDLDIEEDRDVVTTEHVRELLGKVRADFGAEFILTSAPVASALIDKNRSVSPDIDYAELLRDGSFDWYNLQFYNDWGTLDCNQGSPDCTHSSGYRGSPNYDDLVKANPGVSPSRMVAGLPTSPLNRCAEGGYYKLEDLEPILARLAARYPGFGGAYGWTFSEAVVDGAVSPVGWTGGVTAAVRPDAVSLPGLLAPAGQSAAAGAMHYVFRDLGSLKTYEGRSLATAVAEDGTVVGSTETVFVGTQAFAARPGGGLQQLGASAEWGGSQATAVNRAGQVVGAATLSDQSQIACLASLSSPHDGAAVAANTLGGNQAQAWGLNDAGKVVGWASSGSNRPRAVAMTVGGPMVDLGSLGGPGSLATAVSAAGLIVGSAQSFGGGWHAFTKAPEEVLQDVHPDPAAWVSWASAVNDTGQVVGWSLAADGFAGFLLEGSGAPQRLAAPGQAAALAVNSGGQVVGFMVVADGTVHAFVKGPESAVQDLNALVQNLPAKVVLAVATAVNDSGVIVGQTSQGHAFALTPGDLPRRHLAR